MNERQNLLLQVWHHAKSNLDLVALGLATVALPVADWFHLIESPTAAITLMVVNLSVLNAAMWHQRLLVRKLPIELEHLDAFLEVGLNNILLDKYPNHYSEDLGHARELWITGHNLRRVFPERQGEIKAVIERNGTVHVLLLHKGKALEYAAQQELGPDGTRRELVHSMTMAEAALQRLKLEAPDRVDIKTIDYPLPFGIDAIDIGTPHAVIYVRFYPLRPDREDDRPILVLRPYQKKWFNFYREQLRRQFDDYALTLEKVTDDFIPGVTDLAKKLAPATLSMEASQRGFLRPYTEDQYRAFAGWAEHFYILRRGKKKLVGFVLAHSSEKIDLVHDDQSREEIYRYMRQQHGGHFVVGRQIGIDPEFSRSGYGRKLYEFLIECIKKDDASCPTIMGFIWKDPPNPSSEAFHKALGWEEWKALRVKGGGEVGIWRYGIARFG
jgi:GNAT superfamily N-acetyltransferase